jgi:hypothetical protein
MKPAVEAAIAEIEAAEVGSAVRTQEDPDGGAYVIVDGVPIGEGFDPMVSWIGFHITWAHTDPDIYPHFVDPELRYVGSGAAPNQHPAGNLPTGMTRAGMMPGFEISAIQVSRRSYHHDPQTDSALLKLTRVMDFLKTR